MSRMSAAARVLRAFLCWAMVACSAAVVLLASSTAARADLPDCYGGAVCQKAAFDYFLGKLHDPKLTAAIVGNFQEESAGVNPYSVQDGGGPGRGVAQWSVDGRWLGVQAQATAEGQPATSLAVQLDFAWSELSSQQTPPHSSSSYRTVISKMNAAEAAVDSVAAKVAAATDVFAASYEQAGSPALAAREADAWTLYQAYSGDGGAAVAVTAVGDVRPPVVGMASPPGDTNGYWQVAADGGVFAFGDAGFYGSMGGRSLNAPVVGMASTPDGKGYWLVASDGGVFAFGDAAFFGSLPSVDPGVNDVVGIAAAPGGGGYWLVGADGGVFAFPVPGAPNPLPFYGSMGGKHLNAPVVGIAAVPNGSGYWLVGSDGGIYAFGPGVPFYGSAGSDKLNAPVVAMTAAPDSSGYWLVAADGGVFAYPTHDDPHPLPFYGSMGGHPLNGSMVAIAATGDRGGYWTSGVDGGLFAFGDAPFDGNDNAAVPAGTPSNTAPGVSDLRAAVVSVALAEVGNGCLAKYGSCSVAWCAEFSSWVYGAAHVANFTGSAAVSGLIDWAQENDLFTRYDPQQMAFAPAVAGDLAVFGAPGGYGAHVAVVVAVNGNGTVTLVNGNSSHDDVDTWTDRPGNMVVSHGGVTYHLEGFIAPAHDGSAPSVAALRAAAAGGDAGAASSVFVPVPSPEEVAATGGGGEASDGPPVIPPVVSLPVVSPPVVAPVVVAPVVVAPVVAQPVPSAVRVCRVPAVTHKESVVAAERAVKAAGCAVGGVLTPKARKHFTTRVGFFATKVTTKVRRMVHGKVVHMFVASYPRVQPGHTFKRGAELFVVRVLVKA